ncbi:acyl-CoA dehydrogenase [Clostridium carboxidivorans P7]|uniref:Acyl-CoA dehydrogenase domain protein n=1 Tax=Clostridium carboxidivorans P7 TaxID=536227 RepID=C6Q1G4_9CLOT|nr:acyl-CoA dehydrogenase [Clostridium carboxidivorans]AKN33676.1 acyl-CoA dehydrogenase [Clostridium carboxidivorans P7]EET84665.1 acyl-CoA dehydrogenase domain protein [Clostridium carboxidivorans P7]EFG86726.1 butyryl-CoA dehydrogenase [Clostridium carboxidivorans P7]
MSFNLTQEQKMIVNTVREFTKNEIAPIAAEIDETGEFPRENINKMAKLNMLGMPFPVEFGGAGQNEYVFAMCIEEIAKKCASTAAILAVHNIPCWILTNYGTDAQKEKYLRPLLKGEKIGAFALTEPNAGTDSASQNSKAVLKGDSYILNGQKCFITNGGEAGIYIILAMTDKTKGTKGISAFIVEENFKGFSIGKKENKMGIRASATSELIFKDCIIPKENLLGKEGQGFKIAMQALDGGRIAMAAQAVGIAQGAMDETVEYLKQREQFGKPLAAFQGLQWNLADMETRINASRLLVYDAANKLDNGKTITKEASMAKLFAAETAMYVTTKAVQLHGGYGYMKDYPIERMMRDAKITELYEGTSEVQRMVISRSLLK